MARRERTRRYAGSCVTMDPTPPPGDPGGAALPPREPRPLIVHFGVDGAIAFLVLIVPCLFLGIGWGTVLIVAFVIGAVACRFTRQAEERALAARTQSSP